LASNLTTVKGNIRPIKNRVLVTDMHFGEQTTSGGIILGDDDGKAHGIYPRWAKVYDKGPSNVDEYNVGDWIMVEHGRWTRGISVDTNGNKIEVRMVETESVIAYSDKKPDGASIGGEFGDGEHMTIDPSSFIK
jgi:co-chaperonin GroES (HSP10)|tara:strand:+ start:336 stop:737 length:402 start_codon:yes stop_codon:yes gene_type:complete